MLISVKGVNAYVCKEADLLGEELLLLFRPAPEPLRKREIPIDERQDTEHL